MDKVILSEADQKAVDGTEQEFRSALIGATRSVEDKNTEILGNQDRWSKEMKSAQDELTLIKNDNATLNEKVRTIEKARLVLGQERRAAFGDPIRRFAADESIQGAFLQKICEFCKVDVKTLPAVCQKAIGEQSGYGSIEINTHLYNQIYDTLLQYGQWPTLGVIRVSTRITRLPVRTARNVALVILSEGGVIPDDVNFAGTTVNLQVEVIASLLNVALQLIQDGEITDVIADLMKQFIAAVNYRLDYLAFAANGTADAFNGGMTGCLNFGTTASAASTHITLGALYTVDDFIKCITTVDPVVLSRGPKWWVHPTLIANCLSVKDTTGRSIFMTQNESPSYGGIGSILGFPVIPTGALPTANTNSSKVAVFGDPEAMAVGVRTDLTFEYSDQATWNTYQRSFRGVMRGGVKGRIATGLAVLTNAAS